MVHPGRAWQHLASVWKPVAPFAGLGGSDGVGHGDEKRK